jgi:hypothetical protein
MRHPNFDVVLTENLFGDILPTRPASTGSLGMLPRDHQRPGQPFGVPAWPRYRRNQQGQSLGAILTSVVHGIRQISSRTLAPSSGR